MEVDTPAAPAVYIAHTNGAVSLSSTQEVLSVNKEASGSPLIAASVHDGILHTVHSTRGAGSSPGALLGRFSSIGPKLRCDVLEQVAPPVDGALPVAAVHAMGRAVVLWSDGTVAAYDDESGAGEAAYTRKLKGFVNLDTNKSSSGTVADTGKTPGRKKRGLASSNGGASGGDGGGSTRAPAALVDAGDGVVIVVGWSLSASLRLVAIDAIFGAIQCDTNLSSGDILGAATAKLDSKHSIQVCLFLIDKNDVN
jgi:hypothetical protein